MSHYKFCTTHNERVEQFRKEADALFAPNNVPEGESVIDEPFSLHLYSPTIYDKLIQVLDEDYGYFDCPASLNHHGNYDGGLFEHSLDVAKLLSGLLNRELNYGSDTGVRAFAYRVGLFHDICKCVQYIQLEDSTWHWNENCIWDGHGSLSVMLTQKIFEQCGIPPLSFEELACIRWHMGAFDEKENWGFYTKAIKEYPTVLWTHTADMIASQIDEK